MKPASETAVTMQCDDLSATPRCALATAGYRIRPYQPGDEQAWLVIHRAADLYNQFLPDTFARQFGDRCDELPRRQFYLLNPAGTPVGTATAWRADARRDPLAGRVHWLAIVPHEQGRGLAKPLLSTVCRQLLALGCRHAYLTTSIRRGPALNLYYRFGFRPELDSPAACQAWNRLLARARLAPDTLRPNFAEWLRHHLAGHDTPP